MRDSEFPIFLSCPKGLEQLLALEVRRLGATQITETLAGIATSGNLELAYRLCLWSGIANRVLRPLKASKVSSTEELYRLVTNIEWQTIFSPERTFAIEFSGTSHFVRNTQFGAQLTKDAIVDHFRRTTGTRPNVERRNSEIRISVRHRLKQTSISIDLSGESLHRRGYRHEPGEAPLKENLARAILMRAGWQEIHQMHAPLIDPMCGAGTLLIEAAHMALDHAPGLRRSDWGFQNVSDYRCDLWNSLLDEAQHRYEAKAEKSAVQIYGYDKSLNAIRNAERNVLKAGLGKHIHLQVRDLTDLVLPNSVNLNKGLIVTNPPYGKRMGDGNQLQDTYTTLGRRLNRYFTGWNAAVFSANPTLQRAINIKPEKQYRMLNGQLSCRLLVYRLAAPDTDEKPRAIQDPTEQSKALTNRIRKNSRHLGRWARRNHITCYRLYDSDLPEYAVTIDRYGDFIQVSEYQAPNHINANVARKHLHEVLTTISMELGVAPKNIIVKQRQRQRGTSQYTRLKESGKFFIVTEGDAKLLVNLHDYIDTGVFLDHRNLRLDLSRIAMGHRFLNLFSYTATATVHAALGGAKSSISVDLSHPYLNWAH